MSPFSANGGSQGWPLGRLNSKMYRPEIIIPHPFRGPTCTAKLQQGTNVEGGGRGSHTLIYSNQRYTFSLLTPTGKPQPAEFFRCQRATLRPSGVCQRKVKNSLFLIDFQGSYKGGGGCVPLDDLSPGNAAHKQMKHTQASE